MVVVERVNTQEDFRSFLEKLKLKGAIFVVKPSWNTLKTYTSAQILDWLFSALRGNAKIIDGYTAWRNQLNVGLEEVEAITPTNARMRWQWIKEQDTWFLHHTGIDRVLEKHSLEYINVTEETWSMKTLEANEVRDLVDSKYGVLLNQEMYNFVPARVYELRGSTFISLNSCYQSQRELSLSTSNLFTLIPDPTRHLKWIGRNRTRFSQSILEINKIYRSIFSPCYWINELKEQSTFVASKNSIEADSVAAQLLGRDPEEISYLTRLAKVFGGFDKNVLSRLDKSD